MIEPVTLWNQLKFMQSLTLEAGGRRLHYVANSSGRPPQVLMLHGVLRNWRSFYTLYQQLNSSPCSMMALDFRGHGESDRILGCYRVSDYVDDAVEILNRLQEPVVVYGHSLGAMVALAAAVRCPERVKSLICEDPPFETMGQKLEGTALHRYFEGVQSCVRQSPLGRNAMFEAFSNIHVGEKTDGSPLLVRDQRDETSRTFSSECLLQTDPDVLSTIVDGTWLKDFDWKHIAQSIRCPVRLLQGDKAMGGMLTDVDADYVRSSLGHRCRFETFPNIGHSIHWQLPQRIVEMVAADVA